MDSINNYLNTKFVLVLQVLMANLGKVTGHNNSKQTANKQIALVKWNSGLKLK